MKRLLVTFLISGFSFNIGFCQDESRHNCFTILVGKNASTDGSVVIAHNEDDLNDHNFVDLHKVPRIKHEAGEKQIFLDKTIHLMKSRKHSVTSGLRGQNMPKNNI